MDRWIPDRKTFALLLGFWLALLPLYALWLWRDQACAPWDMSTHAKLSLQIAQSLLKGKIFSCYSLSNYYPPLFHLGAAPLAIFSTHPDVFCAANWLWLLVAMWITWLIGRRLVGNQAGLAAALLIPAYTYISWMCRMPMVDLALTATVALTLWILIRDANLESNGQGRALGVAITLGLLAKWPYLFFVTVPIGYALRNHFVRFPGERRSKVFWLPIGHIACWPLILAGPWYVRGIPRILASLGTQLGGATALKEGDPSVLSLQSLTMYARHLGTFYLTIPLLMLFLAGLGWLIFTTVRNRPSFTPAQARGWRILALALGSGFVILTLIANKDERYIMPVVPILAVISIGWIGGLAPKFQRILVMLIALLSFATVSWNLFVHARPDGRDMKLEAAAQWIVEHKPREKGDLKVLVIPNQWALNAAALDYALYRRDHHLSAQRAKGRLDARACRPYQVLLILDPPHPESGIAPDGAFNTEAVKRLPNWQPCATFTRADQAMIVLYAPKAP